MSMTKYIKIELHRTDNPKARGCKEIFHRALENRISSSDTIYEDKFTGKEQNYMNHLMYLCKTN